MTFEAFLLCYLLFLQESVVVIMSYFSIFFITDCETVKKDGCAADCKCKPAEGVPPVCPAGRVCNLYCKDGYEVDENGCVNTCKCKEVTCPLGPLCGLHCKDGYEVDENGCINSCKCKKPKKQVAPCHDGPLCLIYCRHGYQLDSRGCKTCKCKPFIPAGLRPAATGAPATKHDLIGWRLSLTFYNQAVYVVMI